MNRVTKGFAVLLTACMLISFAGCGEERIISQDYQIGNSQHGIANAVMKTDTGYYYSQNGFRGLSLHYYDEKNAKSMYLCNKPECRHDGNEFCAATSDKYSVAGTTLYSNALYINTIEETETSYEFKLLKAALDGSSLSEVVTYFSVNSVGVGASADDLVIHRNKAFLGYSAGNSDNDQVGFNGTAIYDLETGELSYLGEKEGDIEITQHSFCGYGDYMYFITAEKYKKRLCRYSYTDGSVEELPLERNFKGQYTIYDGDTIFYERGNGELYIYNPNTKENRSVDIKAQEWYGISLGEGNGWVDAGIKGMISDGKYLYISENKDISRFSPIPILLDATESDGDYWKYAEINILDKEGNFVNTFVFNTEEILGYSDYFSFHFCGDTIYMQTPKMMYECTREDFVAGKPEFKEVYPIEGIWLPGREETVE